MWGESFAKKTFPTESPTAHSQGTFGLSPASPVTTHESRNYDTVINS